MRRIISTVALITAMALTASAAKIQGVIVDQNCAQDILKNGREATLKQRHSCSLMRNYSRSAYGLITDDQKYFKLDTSGNSKIIQMLKDTRDKDNLRVVVDGDLKGDTLTIRSISEL